MKFGFPLALVALLPGIAFAEEPCTSCWTAHFESSPAGAIVTADYDATSNLPASRCVTPCTLSVPPNSGVQFSAKLEGYRVAPGGPRVYWKNGRLMPDPLTIMFEPIPEALRNIAVPSAPPDITPQPAPSAQPTPLPTQRDIVMSALRRHAGPYLLLAPYIPAPILQNVREITGQPTDDLLAVLDITNLHNGRNGLYFYPDRVVSKSPGPPSTIYYTSLVGRTPRAGSWIVDYGDGIQLEANFGLQQRVMVTIDDILVSLSALPEFRSAGTDTPASRLAMVNAAGARCRPDVVYVDFSPRSLAVAPGLAAYIVEDRPGCAIASVRVVGYANTSSSRDDNQALSVQRAEAVRAAMVASGVNAALITVEGQGSTEIPAPPNDGASQPISRPTMVIVEFE